MKQKSTWGKIFIYTKDLKKYNIFKILFIICIVVLNNIIILLNSYAIDTFIIDKKMLGKEDFVLVYFVSLITLFIFSILWHYLAIYTEGCTVIKLQSLSFKNLQNLSPAYFDQEAEGDLLTRLRNDVEVISETLFYQYNDLYFGIFGSIFASILLFSLNGKVGFYSILLTPVLVFFCIIFVKKKVALSENIRQAVSKYFSVLNERISAIKVVKTLLLEKKSVVEYGDSSWEALCAESKKGYLNAFSNLIINFLLITGICLALYYMGYENFRGEASIGDITAVITAIEIYVAKIVQIVNTMSVFKENEVACRRIIEVIEAKATVIDKKREIILNEVESEGKNINTDIVRGEIEFKNVCFEYLSGQPILNNFELKIDAGQRVAIIGNTGAGKTTIINLLARFYEPQEGTILIDNKDIKEQSLEWLYKNLGYILQKPLLLNGSIMYNLKYGNDKITEEQIISISKDCSLDLLVHNHLDGYDTDVSELSFGERQIVSIVRTIISSPRIVLMDEATSSVDSLTDRIIQKALYKLFENKTSIVIAHRLNTIINADRIILIEDGAILEDGKHDVLLKKRGAYYNLYQKVLAEEKYEKVVSNNMWQYE